MYLITTEQGLSIKLPVSKDRRYGFATNTTIEEVAKQNLKMLLLTNPGERMMIPKFGVGIKRYLFANMDRATLSVMEARIHAQVSRYLPYISISQINFKPGEDPTDFAQNYQFDSNLVTIQISYVVSNAGSGILSLNI